MAGKKSPLHDWHAANGARFVDRGGWQVPDAYGKAELEYAALRNGAGFVDLCHEARFRIEGHDTLQFLNELLTINVERIELRHSGFAYMCNDRGGIIDGFRVYRDENYYLLLGSGEARAQALEWLEEQAEKYNGGVTVLDVTTAQGQIALHGPGAANLLERLAFGQQVTLDIRGTGMVVSFGTARALVLRRMNTQIDGFDIIAGLIYIQALWEKIAEASRASGARPVGLAAREICRIETGIPQFGREMDEDTTPLELNNMEHVDFVKKQFCGRRALLHSTANEILRVMVAFRLDPHAAVEAGDEMLYDTLPIGSVTSATLSPALRCRLALGFVNAVRAQPGTGLRVRTKDGQMHAAEILRPGGVPTK